MLKAGIILVFKTKKYNFFDYITIPFKISPVLCTIIILHNMVIALVPSLKIFIVADFVDVATAIFKGTADTNEIYPSLFYYSLTILYTWIMGNIVGFANTKLSMNATLKFKQAVIKKRASLEYKHIENDKTWDLITRAADNPEGRILEGFNNIINVFSMIVQAVSIIGVLVSFVWWAVIPLIVTAIPMYIISVKGGIKDYDAEKEAQKHTRRSWIFGELLLNRNNIEERAMFSYSELLDKKWYELFEKARKIRLKVQMRYFIKMRAASLLTLLGTIFVSAMLLYPLSEGVITVGILTGLVTAIASLENITSWRLSNLIFSFTRNKEYLKDLTDFSLLSETDTATEKPVTFKDKIEKIEFKNVTFKYPETEPLILDNLSMTLYGDKHYSFVGKNGAGKTTITKLLTGLYTNYEGEIYINNKNLRDYTQAELKGIFSVVYQDFAKYEVSLKESVSLGNINGCDEENIKKAVDVVGLEDEVKRFKDGLDTPLGKTRTDGTDVSGGQWQRIAIARTLISSCPVYILDEPTASLDPISERNVYKLFGRVSKGRMTIFITHRLGAARLADEILVLEDGKIVEQGSHDELLEQSGLYAEMFESQRSWYDVYAEKR